MWVQLGFLFVFAGVILCEDDFSSYGLIGDKINETLVDIISQLGNQQFENFTIASGNQEFGEFNAALQNITVEGLNTTVAQYIKFELFPISFNITLLTPSIAIESENYNVTGQITFPIGNQLLPITGSEGTVSIGMTNLQFCVYFELATNISGTFASNLDVKTQADGITLNIENLMDGGNIGWAFNTVLNDVAIVIFDYYKNAVIEIYLLDQLKDAINNGICQLLPQICGKN